MLRIMDQCDTKIDLLKYMWVNYIFHGPLILLFYHYHRLKLLVYINKWCRPGVSVPLQSVTAIFLWLMKTVQAVTSIMAFEDPVQAVTAIFNGL